MNIQPVKSENVQAPVRPKTPPARAPQPEANAEPAPSVRTARLRDLMDQPPAVRPAEVERGKVLARDPEYPSDNVLAKLAEIFAESSGK